MQKGTKIKEKIKESLSDYQKEMMGEEYSRYIKESGRGDIVTNTVKLHEMGLNVAVVNDVKIGYDGIEKGILDVLSNMKELSKEYLRSASNADTSTNSEVIWESVEKGVGYKDGYKSLEVLTRTVKEFGMLEYKLTDITDDKLKDISVEVIKRVLEGNKDKLIEKVKTQKGKLKGDQRNEIALATYVVLNDDLVKGVLTEKLYMVLTKSKEDTKGKNEDTKNVQSTEMALYKVFDSITDEVAQDRLNRLSVLLKTSELNKFKSLKIGVVKLKDKQGVQLSVKGRGYYISTKGIYLYNNVQKRLEELTRYTHEDDGGLLEWWFSKNGAYINLMKFITQTSKEKITEEDYKELQKLQEVLHLAYNRRKKIDGTAVDQLIKKYGG